MGLTGAEPSRCAPAAAPRARHAFVGTVIALGVAALAQSAPGLAAQPSAEWLVFTGLVLAAGAFTIKIPSLPARFSVSETFLFASVLLYGPAPAAVSVALDGLIVSRRRGYGAVHTLFNMTEPVVSLWAAAHVFFLVAAVPPLRDLPVPIESLVVPLAAMTAVYFMLNSGLTAVVVALHTGRSSVAVWRRHFVWLSLNDFGGASVALLLVVSMRQASLGALAVVLPLLVISYLTSRASMGRIEDATRHAAEVGRLYQSTAETLAMAIDAKDEVTHGHIRRVQAAALDVARALGVTDRAVLSALEAAALLHDIGKLGVPEYILNKPGRLTAAEFEKMKRHVDVGADIVAAIEFPYPVVPIVRHHHENWDGTGYPDSLKGLDIPIGARVLAVVDCFDAITWDRPYRMRMTGEQALAILRENRGTMYDPDVVDAFIGLYQGATLSDVVVPPHHEALAEISRASMRPPEAPALRGGHGTGATEEMLALGSLARSVAGESTFADAAFLVGTHLRRIVPCATCAFFAFEPATDDLVARHVSGLGAARLQGLRIPRGHRLSGWVAANRQTIVNSDAALDLGELVAATEPRLARCLSTPLPAGDTIVGVLTLFATDDKGFTDDQAQVIQLLAPQIAGILRRASEFEVAVIGADRPPNQPRHTPDLGRPAFRIVKQGER